MTNDTVTEPQAHVDGPLLGVTLEELPRKWKWMMALGILMLLGGCLGFFMTVAVTIVTVLFYGSMILVGGVASLLHVIKEREERWQGRLTHILVALLYIAAGMVLLINPVAGSMALTLLLGGMFLAMGAMRIVYGFRCRKKGWRWISMVLFGLVDVLFAVIIAASWPLSSLWIIGIMVSVELIMNGWLLTFTALAVRKLAQKR